jgi:glycosyltransferase involved in cell wall biosynthesis
MEISVIICAHNPRAAYLRRVLDALSRQTVPKDRWEFLLIDNASRLPLVKHWDLTWHPSGRHILEPELGLSAARRRGMQEATGDLIIFVDDDNVLSENYLSEALRIREAWPNLGTWGSGTIVAEFEVQPAEHLKPFIQYLTLRNDDDAYWSNVASCAYAMPGGAGLCVRTKVAQRYLHISGQSNIRITGRKGSSLLGHDDHEICLVGCALGLGMAVFPELKLIHLIPPERVTDDYFIRLVEAREISGVLLRYKWLNSVPISPYSVRGLLSVIKNALTRSGFDRSAYFSYLKGTIKGMKILKHVRRGVGAPDRRDISQMRCFQVD